MTTKTAASEEKAGPAPGGMSWRTQAYLIGALIGLALGLMSAYLYIRASDEVAPETPKKVKTGDAMKVTLAVLALVRQIADLGGKA